LKQPAETPNKQQPRRNRTDTSGSAALLRETDSKQPRKLQLPLDPNAKNPRERWDDFFSKREPNSQEIARLVLELHKLERHEHVIAAIESALIHGRAQPWMYDILALSMQIAGRPKTDIERVLLSRVDFTATNFPSMVYSAAELTRFGADEQALAMYRQASRLIPTRPEPYVLGLKLARKLNDYDAIRWASAGILTTAWTKDRIALHRQANAVALNAIEELRSADRGEEAQLMEQAIADASQRDLVLKLTWNGLGDIDLVVEEPPGTVCSYDNPQSAGGGVLVHDGYGPKQENCYEEYVCAFGAPGNYRVRVRHVWGTVVGKRAQLTVIRYRGTPHETTQELTVPLSMDDQIIRLSLPQGRRTELAPIPKAEVARVPARRVHNMRKLHQLDPEARRAARRFARSRRQAALRQVGAGASFGTVGFQPIITTLSEGASMSAMAVVSGDRRFVRLSTAPVFTAISDVFTFSFQTGAGNTTGN